MACGLRQDGQEPGAFDRGPKLVGIQDLGLSAYPQQHQIEFSAGQGFVPLGIELSPGTPLRLELHSESGRSPWGVPGTRAGAEAPDPLRAKGAVILQLGSSTIVAGAHTLLRVSERVRPQVAINTDQWDPDQAFSLRFGWGEPSVAYDPQLDRLGIAPGQGQVLSPVRSRDKDGSHFLSGLAPGARVWVEPSPKGAEGMVHPRQFQGAWTGTAIDGQSRLFDRATALSLGSGGELRLVNRARSDAESLPLIEMFPALGTRAELLPLKLMDDVETLELGVEPRRFVKLPLSVKAGDLIRVEVRGENRLGSQTESSVQKLGPRGGLREVPLALRNGDRAWLVPGGRERGVYLRVGDRVVELQGNDAIYAPEDGRVEVGVNQCFDGGDWPGYVACRRQLQDWKLDLRVAVGVASAR